MKIIRSRYAGACYGVERALSLVNEAMCTNASPVYTLGPLIHNPQVVEELRQRGVEEVRAVAEVDEGVLVIRSHGVAPAIIEQAHRKNLEVVDATCPHVSRAQKAARNLYEQGHLVVVVGEPEHPEVESICAWAGNNALVAQEPSDLPEFLGSSSGGTSSSAATNNDDPTDGNPANGRIGVVAQTTQTPEAFDAIVDALQKRGIEPIVHNTICLATRQRQEAAVELASAVDVMLVIGGKNSGNTTRLAKLCQAICPRTYHIEGTGELEASWFADTKVVGITAGASTPENQIIAVEQALEQLS
ncbi:MAG: 4-hydroxy-3-methylbut-2-enyl diphosphate reductase [Coriobacteriales bacterium]|jgi:4-hydroxy-3-methylbut-2-enyl diphosphate reductase|nr:4-hydroxy-3-methylbut-2-enyl diphosphate reductase [Coriobacteriales bacterium]